jgi:hypothetical protein
MRSVGSFLHGLISIVWSDSTGNRWALVGVHTAPSHAGISTSRLSGRSSTESVPPFQSINKPFLYRLQVFAFTVFYFCFIEDTQRINEATPRLPEPGESASGAGARFAAPVG